MSEISARVPRAERARAVAGKGELKPPGKHASAKAWNRYLRRLVRALGGCVSSLRPQAQQILVWRTGHGLGRGESEQQVARRLGTSLQRERRLESRAAQALRLASAEGRCGQSAVSVAVSSALLSAAPPEVLEDLAPQEASPVRRAQTSSPASGRVSAPKAAGSKGSRSGARPTVTIQKSALPTLPTSGSGFPWLLLLLAVLAAGALTLAASRRSLMLNYVGMSRQRRRAGSAHGRPRGRAGHGRAPSAGTPTNAAAAAGAAGFVSGAGTSDAPNEAAAGATAPASDEAPAEATGPLETLADWVAASEAVRPAAPIDRGQELEAQGDPIAAMAVYRQADEEGDALAARQVGRLLEARGYKLGAIAAYARADERGDARGAVSLGILLAERGSLAGALDAFERADHRGDPLGAFNRALLLQQQGDVRGAVAALRRAYESDDAEVTGRAGEALTHLGVPLD